MSRAAPAPSVNFPLRLAAFYAGLSFFMGIGMPFFPVWLEAKGLDAQATGIVLAVPMVMRLISVPPITRLADRSGSFRSVLIAASLASVLTYFLLERSQGFASIVLATALASLAIAPLTPLADAYALRGLAARGLAYGPVRVWGSVGFIVANLAAGVLLGHIAADRIIWLLIAALAAVAVLSIGLAPVGTAGTGARRWRAGKGGVLLRSPAFWAISTAAALIQASHAVYYGFSVLDWRAQGLNGTAIGVLWAVGVAAEVGLLAVSPRLPAFITPLTLIGLGAGGATIRWTAMSLDPPFLLLPFLQLLHALSFAATHLGSMQLLARIAPARQFATAQGDFATLLATVMAAAMALSGALYAELGGRAYAAMAIASGLGGAVAFFARGYLKEMPST